MADVLAALPDEPPASSRSKLPVLEGGLLTTAATLGFLYYLAHVGSDFNPMGEYADYVFPVGALLVGLVAGAGYGIVSYLTGVRIRRGLLVTIVVLQLVAYFAAEYIAYVDLLHQVSAKIGRPVMPAAYWPSHFFSYFHHKTLHFAWKGEHDDKVGEPLGMAGYFFVVLAALGFVAGGLIAPVVCLAVPYCEGCQRYMKTKRLGFIAADAPSRKVTKGDADAQAAYAAQRQAAATTAKGHADGLIQAAAAGDVDAFVSGTQAAFGPKRAVNKLAVRVRTDLIHCPGCARGWVRHTQLIGQGKQLKSQIVAKTEVGPEFTDAVLDPAARAGVPA